jgi:hypothetical protein
MRTEGYSLMSNDDRARHTSSRVEDPTVDLLELAAPLHKAATRAERDSDRPKSLREYFDEYHSTAAHNDAIWEEFDRHASERRELAEHRRWVEDNKWGFGDRAFHYLWFLLLSEEVLGRPNPTLLEIGVYKGQVISLWALIARQLSAGVEIFAISPFRGPRIRLRSVLHRAAMKLSRTYRDHVSSGNQYEPGDYEHAVRRIFDQFGLSMSRVHLIRGFSDEAHAKQQIGERRFDLVYVDGGHRFEEVKHDLEYYGERVKPGGFMVLDDASFFQPGTRFWKGHESVSRAADEINPKRFRNVLNVGHNRVYQRID